MIRRILRGYGTVRAKKGRTYVRLYRYSHSAHLAVGFRWFSFRKGEAQVDNAESVAPRICLL